jgi:hypothetical protein
MQTAGAIINVSRLYLLVMLDEDYDRPEFRINTLLELDLSRTFLQKSRFRQEKSST